MTNDAEGLWLSSHIFHSAQTPADDVVLNVVAPVVESWRADGHISNYFFIRYSEGGQHIRLRALLRAKRHSDAAKGILTAAAQNHRDEVVELRWVTYEPEVVRYGGAYGMREAEAVFCDSSDFTIDYLKHISPLGDEQRLGGSLAAITLFLMAAATDIRHATSLCGRHRDIWAGVAKLPRDYLIRFDQAYYKQRLQIERLLSDTVLMASSITGGDSLMVYDFATRLKDTFTRLRDLHRRNKIVVPGHASADWINCVDYLGPSIMHMNNNRLGV